MDELETPALLVDLDVLDEEKRRVVEESVGRGLVPCLRSVRGDKPPAYGRRPSCSLSSWLGAGPPRRASRGLGALTCWTIRGSGPSLRMPW